MRRETDDGRLIYPDRGDLPPILPGYEREEGNPYVLRPLMVPCIFRIKQEMLRNCPSCENKPPVYYYACQKSLPVSPTLCAKCVERSEVDLTVVQYVEIPK